MKITTQILQQKKERGEPIVMLTAYDYPHAAIFDQCGIDVILVGDSVGPAMLGYPDTTTVTMDDMIHHLRAVRRGTANALVLCDMPAGACATTALALANAKRLIECGADAIKVEGDVGMFDQIKAIADNNIAICAHIGYTPQTHAQALVQGKDLAGASALIRAALKLEQCGACMIVLELIPLELSGIISQSLTIPTIGIGAGPLCHGQVQVSNDILGLTGRTFRHAKVYTDTRTTITDAVSAYVMDVRTNQFPTINNCATLSTAVIHQIKNWQDTRTSRNIS